MSPTSYDGSDWPEPQLNGFWLVPFWQRLKTWRDSSANNSSDIARKGNEGKDANNRSVKQVEQCFSIFSAPTETGRRKWTKGEGTRKRNIKRNRFGGKRLSIGLQDRTIFCGDRDWNWWLCTEYIWSSDGKEKGRKDVWDSYEITFRASPRPVTCVRTRETRELQNPAYKTVYLTLLRYYIDFFFESTSRIGKNIDYRRINEIYLIKCWKIQNNCHIFTLH